MAKIVILGSGVMGTAMTVPLNDANHAVHLVGTHLDGDIIQEIKKNRVHPLIDFRLADTVELYTYDQLGQAMKGAELIILGVNSLGIKWAAEMLGPLLSPQVPVLFLTKGLVGDGQNLLILPDALRVLLPAQHRDNYRLAAIGGPMLATELAARRNTSVVITGSDQALLDELADLLRTPYFHIWTSTDQIGVEVCAALKNAYALGVGLVTGWLEKKRGPEDKAALFNPAATIFAQSMLEISYLVDRMGGQMNSVLTLSGAGDLYVTCLGGRNSQMGRLLGLGIPYAEAKVKHMRNITIEGAEMIRAIGPTIETMLDRGELDAAAVPLLRTVVAILCHDAAAKIPWKEFFAGPQL
ncbi:MAG: glycerol-3-phosphate dehydrogenase [Deltaproteobacteria bacterium]|nr:MAG: glycerol-3-phosphate dehydrogenase [Deltaproteobacteria bacterium]